MEDTATTTTEVLGARAGQTDADRPGLVSPDWLQRHLFDADVRVVEVDVSPATYEAGHIEGAVLWNIYTDLKDGDYRLRGQAAIEDLVARSGIDERSTVVFYGYGPAIGLWLLRLYGHAAACILDASRDEWRAQGRPWSTAPEPAALTAYSLPAADARVCATLEQVEAAIGRTGSAIVDVRSLDEYQGGRFWPSGGMEEGGRAGHVPGAVRVGVDDLMDEAGAFRSSAELAERFAALEGSEGEIVTYCTIGARAATAWFVLTYLLGRDGVRVYDGSWAEWGRNPDVPVDV